MQQVADKLTIVTNQGIIAEKINTGLVGTPTLKHSSGGVDGSNGWQMKTSRFMNYSDHCSTGTTR